MVLPLLSLGGKHPDVTDAEIATHLLELLMAKKTPNLASILGSVPTPGRNIEQAAHLKLAPHLVVEARAGSGKTFSLIVGVAHMFKDKIPQGGQKTIWSMLTDRLGFEPTPSQQQAAVWQSMTEGVDQVKTIHFCAFNKAIVKDFEDKWGWMIKALGDAGVFLSFSTLHSLGFSAVRRVFPRARLDNYRVQNIICEIMEEDIRDIRRKKPTVLSATDDLVRLCKMNLTQAGQSHPDSTFADELARLASHYDIETNGYQAEIFNLVPQVLERCKDVECDGTLDFSDMIWLPVALNLPMRKQDMLLIDESQDLCKCQHELVFKAGKRLVFVGDEKQSIYGFSGADTASIKNLKARLEETPQGYQALPLTVTRRCGKAIVKEAQKIVPDFHAHESNPEGNITRALYPTYEEDGTTKERPYDQTYMPLVQPGDMVICRVNAPLVSQCFRFLKAGKKANILGRDIGSGLTNLIKKLDATDIKDLAFRVGNWLMTEIQKEQAKKFPSEGRIITLEDKADCLVWFIEGEQTIDGVIRKIESVFTDDRSTRAIRLSSIHKAKGLESYRVFLLEPPRASVPHPLAKSGWQLEQDWCLRYVAITRAIEELVYVS